MLVQALPLDPVENDYYDQARPELVAVARKHGVKGRVLDVGCSRGWLGRELLSQGIATTVHGIEIDADAARTAATRLTKVFCANLEHPAVLDQLGSDFDAMVFADVLEHLRSPQDVLAAMLARLRPGGVAIISLPNIRHHAVVRDLVLRNRWVYQDAGVLDRTHLRFFTSSTAQHLCREAGLRVDATYGGVGPKALKAIRLAPGLLTFAAAQLVLVATKS